MSGKKTHRQFSILCPLPRATAGYATGCIYRLKQKMNQQMLVLSFSPIYPLFIAFRFIPMTVQVCNIMFCNKVANAISLYFLKGYSEIIAVTTPSFFIKSDIFAFW